MFGNNKKPEDGSNEYKGQGGQEGPENLDLSQVENPTSSGSNMLKPSIISEGFEFTGDMKSGGSITVDGTFKGNLSVQTLLIGANGLVDGTVNADSINVKGRLLGTIDCRDLVIGGRATVDGKLSYASITIQRGGTVKGDLKRK